MHAHTRTSVQYIHFKEKIQEVFIYNFLILDSKFQYMYATQ